MVKNHGNWYVPSTGILPGGEEPDINFTGYPRGYSANRIADIKTLKVDYFLQVLGVFWIKFRQVRNWSVY